LLFDKFLDCILYISVATALIALIFYFVGFSLNPKYAFAATGYFGHSNTIAFIYTLSIPILFYKLFSKKISLLIFFALISILLLGLLFSYSRSAYIGVFVSIMIISFKKSKFIFLIVAALLLIIGSKVFMTFAFAKGDSSNPRIILMFTSYNMIFHSGYKYLLWGYGIFNNVKVFTGNQLIFGGIEEVPDPHNMALLLAIEFGVLFTIAFLSSFLYIIIRSFSRKKGNDFNYEQKINLSLAIIIGLFAHNMLEDIIVYPEFFVFPLFLIYSGYLYRSIYTRTKKNDLYIYSTH
jgi:hypothetical protein